MTDRALGTRRNTGLFLMAVGVLLLLCAIGLTLSEVTTLIAQVRSVVFITGIAALITGAIFYLLARSGPR